MSAWRHLCLAFGARLKFLREEQDIAVSEIAEAIGCTRQAIHQWERGSAFPSLPTLLMVASALDCSLVDLMPEEAHHRVEPIRERTSAA